MKKSLILLISFTGGLMPLSIVHSSTREKFEEFEEKTIHAVITNHNTGEAIGNIIKGELDENIEKGVDNIIAGANKINSTNPMEKTEAIVTIIDSSLKIGGKVKKLVEDAASDDSDDEGQKHEEKDSVLENIGEVVDGIFGHEDKVGKDGFFEKTGRKIHEVFHPLSHDIKSHDVTVNHNNKPIEESKSNN